MRLKFLMKLGIGATMSNAKKAALGLSVAGVVLLGFYILTLIVQQQSAVKEVSRYHVTWMISQTALAVARLTASAGAYEVPSVGVDREDIQLRLDVVLNHLGLMTAGVTGKFVSEDPELNQIVSTLSQALRAAQPLINELGPRDSSEPLVKLLLPLNAHLPKLASSAYSMNGDLVTRSLDKLNQLYVALSGILLALLVGTFVLMLLFARHNRLLDHARRQSQRLIVDLQNSAHELQAANNLVRRAVEEVDKRNQVLLDRDFTLMTQNVRFDAALNNMSQALCMADDEQRLIVCNLQFRRMFDLSEEDVTPGTAVRDVFRTIYALNPSREWLTRALWSRQQTLAVDRRHGAFFEEDKDGHALAVSHQPMVDGGWVAPYEDITERRQVDARISYLAHHDAITELPNRVLFTMQLEQAAREIINSGRTLALLFLDLDRFKQVNDTLGHPAGDALLEMVGQRLRNCVRETDVVARFGGDEFAVLQRSINHPDDAEGLARRIIASISEPYDLAGRPANISASVGIVVSSEPHVTSDTLLKDADLALYQAKAQGGATYRFFERSMNEEIQARRKLELDLREAVRLEQFELWYQPVFDLEADRVAAFEALLRWRHPVRGLVSPSEFVGVAEEVGLIVEIGTWVLRRACADAADWPADVLVAVNLSPVQFRGGNLVQTVCDALDNAGLAADRLELEITETALLRSSDNVVDTMHQLRRIGVRIALDDFGTGYSSLSYLRSFPFDRIKVDRSFVAEMSQRPDCLAIVVSIARLGKELGMATTAEGVETAEQLALLHTAGCTAVQGYYFARPEPLGEIQRWFDLDEPRLKFLRLGAA
jgi:diguanylate cyclase (GGDEF)-like protein